MSRTSFWQKGCTNVEGERKKSGGEGDNLPIFYRLVDTVRAPGREHMICFCSAECLGKYRAESYVVALSGVDPRYRTKNGRPAGPEGITPDDESVYIKGWEKLVDDPAMADNIQAVAYVDFDRAFARRGIQLPKLQLADLNQGFSYDEEYCGPTSEFGGQYFVGCVASDVSSCESTSLPPDPVPEVVFTVDVINH